MKKIIQAMLPVLLLAMPYLLMVLPAGMAQMMGTEVSEPALNYPNAEATDTFDRMLVIMAVMYGVIVLTNAIWLIYQTASGISAQRLLFWNMLIKLCYIPVFLYVFLTMLMGMAMFWFGGIIMTVMALLALLVFFIPTCFYGVCGCIRAAKERTLNAVVAVAFGILHCIVCVDVVIAVVSYCMVRSNNKKRLKEQMNANTYYNGTMYPNGNEYQGNGYMR